MNEYKFRAFNKRQGIMLDWETIKRGKLSQLNEGEDVEYMQWTGLKDHNGKEIYDGDIIEGKFNGAYAERVSWNGPPDIRAKVFWDYSGFRLQAFGEKDRRYSDFWDYLQAQEFESDKLLFLNHEEHTTIIGNIWETPELLK